MLRDEQILTIYQWYLEGAAVKDIATHFGITPQHVHAVVKGRVHKPLHQLYFLKSKEVN